MLCVYNIYSLSGTVLSYGLPFPKLYHRQWGQHTNTCSAPLLLQVLIKGALAAGSSDNITVVLVDLMEPGTTVEHSHVANPVAQANTSNTPDLCPISACVPVTTAAVQCVFERLSTFSTRPVAEQALPDLPSLRSCSLPHDVTYVASPVAGPHVESPGLQIKSAIVQLARSGSARVVETGVA